jgi:hypothetical protein
VLPGLWRIRRLLTIPDSQQIAPCVYSSPKIIVLFGDNKYLSGVCPSDPAVIDSIKFRILPLYFGEIFIDKGVGIIKGPKAVIEIVIFYTSDSILDYFRNPLSLKPLLPILVEGLDCKLEVRYFVGEIQFDPSLDVLNGDSVSRIGRCGAGGHQEVFNDLDGIFRKYIFRRLARSNRRQHLTFRFLRQFKVLMQLEVGQPVQ